MSGPKFEPPASTSTEPYRISTCSAIRCNEWFQVRFVIVTAGLVEMPRDAFQLVANQYPTSYTSLASCIAPAPLHILI